eukprot:sb/3471247/
MCQYSSLCDVRFIPKNMNFRSRSKIIVFGSRFSLKCDQKSQKGQRQGRQWISGGESSLTVADEGCVSKRRHVIREHQSGHLLVSFGSNDQSSSSSLISGFDTCYDVSMDRTLPLYPDQRYTPGNRKVVVHKWCLIVVMMNAHYRSAINLFWGNPVPTGGTRHTHTHTRDQIISLYQNSQTEQLGYSS